MFMYYENRIIGYTYKEQLQDLLPGISLAACMGILVNLIRYVPINDGLTLVLQVIVGAVFYVTVSYLTQMDSFVYLIKMLIEKLGNAKMKKILKRMVKE